MVKRFNRSSFARTRLVLPAALLLIGATRSSTAADHVVHVRGGKMATRMVNGKMILTGVQGDVGGGTVRMAGNVSAGSDKTNSATVKFDKLPLEKAAALVGQSKTVAQVGNILISGYAKGEWRGDDLKEISLSANGNLTAETGPGVITDENLLARLRKMLHISDLKQVRYSKITLKAHAADGHIVVDHLNVTGPDCMLVASGTYDAQPDELNLRIVASVAPDLAAKSSYMKLGGILGFFKGETKTADGEFVNVPTLLVSGNLKTPKIALDKPKVASAADELMIKAKPTVADAFERTSRFILSETLPGETVVGE